MAGFHMVYGILLIVLALLVTGWEVAFQGGVPRMLRGITIGLMDLQIIFGIITWIIKTPSKHFIGHPILMVAAIVILHIMTGRAASRSRRITGWVVADILFIVGAAIYHT